MWFSWWRSAIVLLLIFSAPAEAQDVWVTGYTRPVFDLNLSLPVSGRVEELLVREGDHVEARSRLLSLDSKLEVLEVARRRSVLEGRSELNGALARQPLLVAQLRAARNMFANGASISREDLQARELAVIAVNTEIETRRAQKHVEQIELEAAIEVLDRRSLLAPISGRIARIMRLPGESIQANETLVRLVAIDRLLFVGALEARLVSRLVVGSAAQVVVDDGAVSVLANGRVTLVGPVADPASGLVEVRIQFDNPDEALRAGLPARLRLSN